MYIISTCLPKIVIIYVIRFLKKHRRRPRNRCLRGLTFRGFTATCTAIAVGNSQRHPLGFALAYCDVNEPVKSISGIVRYSIDDGNCE